MGTSKMNFPFDTTLTDRIIVSFDASKGKYSAALRLVGAAAGYGVFSTGDTPSAALERAAENAALPARWRKLRF